MPPTCSRNDACHLIVGHQAERVEEQLSAIGGLEFVLQQPQNGTGHAVQQLLPVMEGFEGELLVLTVMCRYCGPRRLIPL